MATQNQIFRHFRFCMPRFLVNMNFILIRLRLLIKLNSTSDSSRDHCELDLLGFPGSVKMKNGVVNPNLWSCYY